MEELALFVRADDEDRLTAKINKFKAGPVGGFTDAGELFGNLLVYFKGEVDMPAAVLSDFQEFGSVEPRTEEYYSLQYLSRLLIEGFQDEHSFRYTMAALSLFCPSFCTLENGDVTVYKVNSLVDCAMALLHSISLYRKTLLKCKRCGRWFIPSKRSDEFYCNRIYSGEVCKDAAVKAVKLKRYFKRAEDEIYMQHRAAWNALIQKEGRYKKKLASAHDANEETELKEKLQKVQRQITAFTAGYKDHMVTIEEFRRWLVDDIGLKLKTPKKEKSQ